jgi:broad specificity phosphatase PhoE
VVSLQLVRHAQPAYDRAVAAHLWPLAAEGLAEAARLSLPPGAYLAASDEPKAWQTLAPHGPVVREPGFGEVRRVGEPWDGPYRDLRRAYVDGADHPGWEARAEVAARFDGAVEDHLVRARGRPLVVGSHGLAMTVWLTARVGLADPGDFWAGLRFPDVVAVDLAAGTIARAPL